MVKTKSKKSVIALVVMAILLVLSMAMTITGAWFTDYLDQETDSLEFGKIDIEWNASNGYSFTYDCEEEGLPVMPGCVLTLEGTIDNLEEKAYIGYKMTIAFTKDVEIVLTSEQEAAGWSYTGNTLSIDEVVVKDSNESVVLDTTFAIPETLGNAAQGATAEVTLDVAAVQFVHVDGTGDAGVPTTYDEVKAFATASTSAGQIVATPAEPGQGA